LVHVFYRVPRGCPVALRRAIGAKRQPTLITCSGAE
jgi:hypothetical protein